MHNLNLSEWAYLAQIVLAAITLMGIVVSMYLSVKALREVQTDRKIRQKPHLQFEIGGQQLPIEFFKQGKFIAGINPKYAHSVLSQIPNDAECIRIKQGNEESKRRVIRLYGNLINYGLGPALSTSVCWVPKEIWIGSEKFDIDNHKLSEPIYSEELNSIPASPSHILPGKSACFFRLPTFIAKDFEKKISKVEGVLKIMCEDVFENSHTFFQGFYIITGYQDKEEPYVHITFRDYIKEGGIEGVP